MTALSFRTTLLLPTLLLLAVLLLPLLVFGQDGGDKSDEVSVKSMVVLIVAITTILGAVVSLVVALFTARRIVEKKVAEEVKLKAKSYVDEFFAKELHIDPNVARTFFERYQQKLNRFAQQRIFVIHHPEDEDQRSLVEYLSEEGFATTKSQTIEGQLVVEAGDILIFDATQNLSNDDIDTYTTKDKQAKARLFYYGKEYQRDRPLRFTGFSNSSATLIDRVKQTTLARKIT